MGSFTAKQSELRTELETALQEFYTKVSMLYKGRGVRARVRVRTGRSVRTAGCGWDKSGAVRVRVMVRIVSVVRTIHDVT